MTKNKKKIAKPKEPREVMGMKSKDIRLWRSPIGGASFYVASELADDEQIQGEILGKMLDVAVYTFTPSTGKPVFGLSSKGVREAVRLINRNPKSGMKIILRDDRCFVEEKEFNGQKGILVRTYAVDMVSGSGNWGVKFEAFKTHTRSGTIDNTFVMEKALTKAQRNAMDGLIPLELKVKMIEKFKEKGSIQKIEPPKEIVRPRELKPTTPERTVAIIEQLIETTNEPEELMDITNRIEEGKNVPEPARSQLAKKARMKANTLLDKMAQ